MREVIVEVPDNYTFNQEAVSVKGNLTRCKNCTYGRPHPNGIMCDRDYFVGPDEHYCSIAKPKKVETISEQPLIRCKDCKHYNERWKVCEEFYYQQFPEDFYCGNAERRDEP